MSVGIVLVHGYTGSPEDMDLLAHELRISYGKDAVTQVALPGHDQNGAPDFDVDSFRGAVEAALTHYLNEGRTVIGIGHSTGGNLLLSAVHERRIHPDGLVLVAVPRVIDAGYGDRWRRHRSGKPDLPFRSVARMVTFINRLSRESIELSAPIFFLHGRDDVLVPHSQSFEWRKQLSSNGRVEIIPSVGHDAFKGPMGRQTTEAALRAVHDVLLLKSHEPDTGSLQRLIAVEPDVQRFMDRNPYCVGHLMSCPGVRKAVGIRTELQGVAQNDPVLANIEITTHCMLKCRYCARSIWDVEEAQMELGMFKEILSSLPNTYKITLVGLGEPLLHPRVADFVAEAASRGCKVSLVTNGMHLPPSLSRELLRAGLRGLTFSVDAVDRDGSDPYRGGFDYDRVISNIRGFVEYSEKTASTATAVFSVVSKASTPYLTRLADMVAGLGVKAMMVTDLNFERNTAGSLRANMDDDCEQDLKDFISRARSRNLVLLSVRGLEAFGIERRFHEYYVRTPSQIHTPSPKHTWCHSPWQTIPIGVRGDVTVCDCRPDEKIGNLLKTPLRRIWNDQRMIEHRTAMLSPDPPSVCRICPRF